MDGSTQIFFFLAAFASVVSILISALKCLERTSAPFRSLAHFLAIFLICLSGALSLQLKVPGYVAIVTLTWILIYEASAVLLQSTAKVKVSTKRAHQVFGFSLLPSAALQLTGQSTSWVMTPLALVTAFYGIKLIILILRLWPEKKFSMLQHLNLLGLLGFFVSRAFVPWITSEYSFEAVIKLDCVFLILFSQTLYPLLSSEIFEKHETLLKTVLEARNKQLFEHTHFSEFKTLSSGVVHEINNALTVINFKIQQLLRTGPERGPEKDLKLIQTSVNRINISIRGLREFIYPTQTWENLELEEIFRHVQLLYGQRLINHHIKLNFKGVRGKHINGNRIQIEQVFLSLLNHSVEALDPLKQEKWIEISGSKQRGKLEIIFSDSGPNLNPAVVKMINSQEISVKEDVTPGIGLIQAKNIIEAHGGTIEYVNRSEKIVCQIRLPLSFQSKKTYPTSKFGSVQNPDWLH